MRTKPSNQVYLVRVFAILYCGMIVSGCNPKKPPAPEEPKAQVENARVENAHIESETPAVEKVQPEVASNEVTPADTTMSPVDSSKPAMPKPEMPAEPPQTWSVERIIARTPNGPVLIDVHANIGGKSLEEASTIAMNHGLAQIEKDLEKPWTWEKLLDHPLVASGWLGNLVPNAQQRNDVISRYNLDGDEEADEEELPAFFTRGLARRAPMVLVDVGFEPGVMRTASPWGQLDVNGDSVLDAMEIAKVVELASRLDSNGDRVVTLAESRPSPEMTSAGSMGGKVESAEAVGKDQPKKIADGLLRHYSSFMGSLSQEQWPSWSDALWNRLDVDADKLLTSKELEQITTVPPHIDLKVQLQESTKTEAVDSANISAKVSSDSDLVWDSRLNSTGQATGKSGAMAAVIVDSYTPATRDTLRRQLVAALTNPQIAMAVRGQLQLSEGAFDLLNSDNDDQLSDEEFEKAWNWITAVRGSRVLLRWILAEPAWFHLADRDGDNRLTEIELKQFSQLLAGLDSDHDGSISPSEMPYASRLEVTRADIRLASNPSPTVQPDGNVQGWFAASDSNNDGVVGSAEFLGSSEDFQSYDTNNDGFISASEAYKTAAARVQ